MYSFFVLPSNYISPYLFIFAFEILLKLMYGIFNIKYFIYFAIFLFALLLIGRE
jgi:hypothetical protein